MSPYAAKNDGYLICPAKWDLTASEYRDKNATSDAWMALPLGLTTIVLGFAAAAMSAMTLAWVLVSLALPIAFLGILLDRRSVKPLSLRGRDRSLVFRLDDVPKPLAELIEKVADQEVLDNRSNLPWSTEPTALSLLGRVKYPTEVNGRTGAERRVTDVLDPVYGQPELRADFLAVLKRHVDVTERAQHPVRLALESLNAKAAAASIAAKESGSKPKADGKNPWGKAAPLSTLVRHKSAYIDEHGLDAYREAVRVENEQDGSTAKNARHKSIPSGVRDARIEREAREAREAKEASKAHPVATPEPTPAAIWAAATAEHDAVREAWGAIATDPLAALDHTTLLDVTQTRTATFIEALGTVDDLRAVLGSTVPHHDRLVAFVAATRRARTAWTDALAHSRQVKTNWLPVAEARLARRASALLTTAADETATLPERAAAARKAAELLSRVESFVVPAAVITAIENQALLALPAPVST